MPRPAKIYDRPERTGPPPMVLALIVLVVLIVGYFAYRALVRPAAQQHTRAGVTVREAVFLLEGKREWMTRASRW